MGFAGQAHLGDGIEPVPGGGIEGAAVGDRQTREDMLVDRAHAVFHAAVVIAFPDIARGNGKAMVRGNVQGCGMQDRGVAHGTLQDGGCAVVDHHFVRNAPKDLKGVLVAGEEVCHRLGDGDLDVQQATVAQDHDKETHLAVRLSHGDGAEGPPLPLGTLAGGKGQREKGRLPPGSYRAPIGFDQPIAAGKTVLAQALEDLRGRIGMTFQQPDNVRFKLIELAGVRPGFPRAKVGLDQPVGPRAAIKGAGLGDLRGVQALVGMQRANTAFRSTGASSAATVEALGVASLGAASRAKTWERGR